jgi:hypothetical protein
MPPHLCYRSPSTVARRRTQPTGAGEGVRGRLGRIGLIGIAAGLAGGVAAPALGQDRASRIEEAERVMPRVDRDADSGPGGRVVLPTRSREARPVTPGLTGGADWTPDTEDWAEAAGLRAAGLPEGSFLIERPGRLLDGPGGAGGRKIFVPTAEDRVAGEGPMLVLPSATLERLELALTGSPDGAAVRVSGEVFVYHGRSHLLMTSYLLGAGAPAAVEGEPEKPAPDAEPADAEPTDAEPAEPDEGPASLRDDPDVRALLEELEAARPGGPGGAEGAPETDPRAERAGGAVIAPDGTAPAPDGTPIVRRRGRLVRTGEGAWAFVFDNDHDDALAAQSMVVMPCLLLQRIERQAMIEGDAFELVLSGRVHTHRGQAYLLPTMMLRVPVTGVVPMR